MTVTTNIYQSGSCGVGFICDINGKEKHEIVKSGIEAVKNLTHRGAVGADQKTGDGAGILTEIPRKFFLREIRRAGLDAPDLDNLAIGVFFLYQEIESGIEEIIKNFGLKTIFWRDVPTYDDALGKSALLTKPVIKQLLINTEDIDRQKVELTLYLARRAIEKRYGKDVYIPSISSKSIIYKGMLVATNLELFYPDLVSEDFESAFCIFHQRFSTNTSPDWRLAQPFRVLSHNGEINTIAGNRNHVASIEHEMGHELSDNIELIKPLVSAEESDSASLDRVIELLIISGHSPLHAINMCIPPAWEHSDMSPHAKAFFEYQSLLMKPWDGPAAIAFTDGNIIGAHLDRNGLRPLRYSLTEDGIIVLGSEAGIVNLQGRAIKQRGRLGPGDTISVDIKNGSIKCTDEIINELAAQRPYREWLGKFLLRLKEEFTGVQKADPETTRKQIALGYTSEEIGTSIKEMAEKGKEMVFSMGDDTPLPPLAKKPQLLYRYFKQRFSQVTNPPIDSIRERIVMSLRMNLGYKKSFIRETAEHARRLQIDSPVLFGSHIKEIEDEGLRKVERIEITYPKTGKGFSLSDAVKRLQIKVIKSVRKGMEIIILSDIDISYDRIAIPALLAISASFKSLKQEKLTNRVSIILETGEARDAHHFACLIGYGAGAVFPWLAFETIKKLCDRGELNLSFEKAALNYRKAIEDGLLKIIAKMGISTLNSYHNARLFDTICLNRDFMEEYFGESDVVIEADSLNNIEASLLKRHAAGFEAGELSHDFGGNYKQRRGMEYHEWSTSTVASFKKFIKTGEYDDYKKFSRITSERPLFIRDLLGYKKGIPVDIEDVEPEEQILKRLFTGAMSLGALSPEAHETIAEACNRLGIRSNSGEGGEDLSRLWGLKNSAIKQIASGRFGVTPAYIASATELEIKIAQGAKPGEGGHLPADKVTEYIAALRHCEPGTLLISPPPHHDIYSIEDLAQLINDLKEANPIARVSVKLVSERGVGTVAAAVAKAYADIIQISGCEGGTGAAGISSIKNAGSYWETGLAETQRILIENGLRERIRLRVDGGLTTGRDIIKAALLGAEEFGFGTATMIATGCVMARKCHLNTCPTGVATQDERLRKRFRGSVEDIMAYFRALVHEIREIMAETGFRRLDDIIGRTDLLTASCPESFKGAERIKLDRLFEGYPEGRPVRCRWGKNDNPALTGNDKILKDLIPYIEKAEPVEREYEIRNVDRSIPLKLNHQIAMIYKDKGLPPDTIRLTFRGTAGQSFGAFNHKGLTLTLIGDANDYAGKGMYGGRIIIRPAGINEPHRHVIMGNTVLYGAIGGEFYASGRAGERFAVRNSGTIAVVEGTGHHLCEYMTEGVVVVLGDVGYNVGAGMTGGVIYVLDEENKLRARLNNSFVVAHSLKDEYEVHRLKYLIENHYKYTGSPRAGEILYAFDRVLRHFFKVTPTEDNS